MFLDFNKTLAAAIDAKDPYTRGHSQRVSDVSVAIARQMGLSGDLILDVRVGSLLHDIGKIGITDAILTKPNHLTTEEYEQMKRHPSIGYRIMYPVNLLRNVLPAIIEHHERLDGSGYPLGLQADQVSLMGRIVAVADVYDALTTDRPYRKAMDLDTTLEYMQKNVVNNFDSTCVERLIEVVMSDESLRNTQ
jgi:putative nucleotidyltransferase with HDIG domain